MMIEALTIDPQPRCIRTPSQRRLCQDHVLDQDPKSQSSQTSLVNQAIPRADPSTNEVRTSRHQMSRSFTRMHRSQVCPFHKGSLIISFRRTPIPKQHSRTCYPKDVLKLKRTNTLKTKQMLTCTASWH